MADPQGFLKLDRATPTRRPVDVRIRDWKEVYEDFPAEASREQAKRLSSFAYGKLLEAILARSAKVGVEIRWVDPAWTSLVGWAKYGSAFGINPDQAAAFCIDRKAALSKNHRRRGKVLGEWVDVHARPERLDGLKSKASPRRRVRVPGGSGACRSGSPLRSGSSAWPLAPTVSSGPRG